MSIHKNNVKIGPGGNAVCPWHGEQDCEYAELIAPCGCQFVWKHYEICDRLVAVPTRYRPRLQNIPAPTDFGRACQKIIERLLELNYF